SRSARATTPKGRRATPTGDCASRSRFSFQSNCGGLMKGDRNLCMRPVWVALLAPLISLGGGCANAKQGAVSGAGVGALSGLVIGSMTGSAGKGAAIGAVVGGVGGAVIGDQNKKKAEQAAAAQSVPVA